MSDTTFKGTYFYANGKRKTAVARVRLYKGTGRILVNEKSPKDYFSTSEMINVFMAPLIATHNEKNYDISAKIIGGGTQSHAEALRHGIAKALVIAENGNRQTLKPLGYLTRDSRVKERKKYGLHRARRAPQFSKR